jgi:hypothetical protein
VAPFLVLGTIVIAAAATSLLVIFQFEQHT